MASLANSHEETVIAEPCHVCCNRRFRRETVTKDCGRHKVQEVHEFCATCGAKRVRSQLKVYSIKAPPINISKKEVSL